MEQSNTSNSKKRMLDALEKNKGVVTYAAQDAEISRTTHYQWLKEDPEYKVAVDEIQDTGLDFAERQLFRKMEGVSKQNMLGEIYQTEPDTTAIIFYLKTKGKKRGYNEKAEEQDKQPNINIIIQSDTPNAGD